MASRYWNGVNTDATDTANWSSTRGGSTGSAAPTSSDTAYFYDGDGDVLSNTDNFPAGAVVIGGKFGGNIGTGGTPLRLSTAGCSVTIENVAPGKKVIIGAYTSTTISATMRIRSTGSGSVSISNGASGVITNVTAGKTGLLYVLASGVITNLKSIMRVIAEPGTAFTTGDFESGGSTLNLPHLLQRSVTTLTVGSGAYVRSENSVAFTTATNDGYLVHDSDGTIATYVGKPNGRLVEGSTPYAITNAELWEGTQAPDEGGRVTYSNTPTRV